jgi:uronate dehydrogenase
VSQRVLITGAAGGMGTLLRPRLARPGRVLRLLDIADVPPGDDVEVVRASVTDPAAMLAACDGVDAIVHLGGHSREAPWADILEANIHGTYCVLEAAREAGVPRVVFASSNHAVGFHRVSAATDYLFPRPDTFYGVSKVAGEALGSLYHDRFGLDVVCVRIGTCIERPLSERHLGTWLSPDDCARLLEAAFTTKGFHVVWGASANTRGVYSLDAARALGYEPRDDSEKYANDVTPASEVDHTYLGGEEFCAGELGG